MKMVDLVVVNDGQYRWGADRGKLEAALEKLGWQHEGGLWREPARGEDDDPGAAYAALCREVQPEPGFGPDDYCHDGSNEAGWTYEPGIHGSFTFLEDRGGWRMDQCWDQ
jgi:hypothetical protein